MRCFLILRSRKILFFSALTIAVLCTAVIPAIVRIHKIPDEIFITNGESKTLDFGLPLYANISADASEVINFNGTSLKDTGSVDLNTPITLSSNKN